MAQSNCGTPLRSLWLKLLGAVIAALPFVRAFGRVRMASETPAARPYTQRAYDLANLTKARASLATLQ